MELLHIRTILFFICSFEGKRRWHGWQDGTIRWYNRFVKLLKYWSNIWGKIIQVFALAAGNKTIGRRKQNNCWDLPNIGLIQNFLIGSGTDHMACTNESHNRRFRIVAVQHDKCLWSQYTSFVIHLMNYLVDCSTPHVSFVNKELTVFCSVFIFYWAFLFGLVLTTLPF